MKISSVVISALLSASSPVSADVNLIPLPGLTTKPHLQHLKREDLALEKLFDYDVKGPVNHFNGQDAQQNKDFEQVMEEVKKKEQEHQEIHFGPSLKSKHRQHPNVKSSSSYCGRAVDRLKAGPVNIPDLVCKNEKYVDSDFSGGDMVYWTDYNTYGQYATYESYISSGTYYFRNWDDVYPNADILDADGTISYNEAIQGGAGTCYLIATLGSMGEFPDLVKNLFLTQQKNDADAIAIKFYVRGKPWVVTINEEMLFQYSNPVLKFAQPASDQKAMWAAIMEKAWAKLKGNYLIAEGGLVENGLHYLVGIPVIRYSTADITTQAEADAAYDVLAAADAANYLMGAGTAGAGNDQVQNACGIAQSHAYSVLAAFTMTDSAGVAHKCLLIRNPWGVVYYNQEWNKDDASWTDDLVAQVPFGVDVRTQQSSEGLFVVPISKFIGQDCFSDYQIGHQRESEGYQDRWYDQDNAVDEYMYAFTFTPDLSISSDLYFTVETYAHEIVPTICTTGSIANGQSVSYPVAYLAVYDDQGTSIDYQYYLDQRHKPIMISTSAGVSTYNIYVKYEFVGSPHNDFTLKVYSKYNIPILDSSGNSNEVHMDGQQPSGFTSSNFIGMDNWDCSMSAATATDDSTQEEERDVSQIEVASLMDVFAEANSVGEFFGIIWYNPMVCIVWFKLW